MKCQVRDCGRYDTPEPAPLKFLSLSLEIPGYNTTLEACLANFFAPQDRQWQCDECKQHRTECYRVSSGDQHRTECYRVSSGDLSNTMRLVPTNCHLAFETI